MDGTSAPEQKSAKRAILLCPALGRGNGAARAIRSMIDEWAKAWCDEGCRPEVWTTSAVARSGATGVAGVRTRILSNGSPGWLGRLRFKTAAISALVRVNPAEVACIHLHGEPEGSSGGWLGISRLVAAMARLRGIPMIASHIVSVESRQPRAIVRTVVAPRPRAGEEAGALAWTEGPLPIRVSAKGSQSEIARSSAFNSHSWPRLLVLAEERGATGPADQAVEEVFLAALDQERQRMPRLEVLWAGAPPQGELGQKLVRQGSVRLAVAAGETAESENWAATIADAAALIVVPRAIPVLADGASDEEIAAALGAWRVTDPMQMDGVSIWTAIACGTPIISPRIGWLHDVEGWQCPCPTPDTLPASEDWRRLLRLAHDGSLAAHPAPADFVAQRQSQLRLAVEEYRAHLQAMGVIASSAAVA